MARHPSNYRPFDQAVADAQAIVNAKRLRLVGEHERATPPPQSVLLTRSRERKARIHDALAVLLMLALMAALGVVAFALAAPNAKADAPQPSPAVIDYVNLYGEPVICHVLDSNGNATVSGFLGVLRATESEGFTPYEAGQIVGMSVTEFCPDHTRLMQRFVEVYGGQVTA